MAQCIPTQDNVEYIHWIYYIFGDCVYGFQDAVSVLLGYLSIFCWLNAQLPQVVENYKVGSVDSLSINFLSIWLAADFANLVGCLLTHQLPFQRYLGMYFVFIDVCLLLQWIYYSKIKRKRTSFTSSPRSDNKTDPLSKAFQHPSVRTPLLIEHATKTLEDELKLYSASASPSKWYTLNDHIHHYTDLTHCESNNSSSSSSNTSTSTSSNNNRNKQIGSVLMAIMLFGTRIPNPTMTTTATAASMTTSTAELDTVVIGRIFAWICTALYLLSRLPQILKNRRRKSVEGLSPALFAFAACGNLTYSSSVLLHPGHTRETLLEAVPYLIGSAGTLVFDATIFLQFLWYRRKSTHPHPHPAISSA